MMHFRCGTFMSPTVAGEQDFDTGLPGICTALFLTSAASTAMATVEDSARISFGATDGTTQWAVSAGVLNDNVNPVVDADDVMDTSHSNTSIVRIINEAGTLLAEAEFVSFNGDGTVTLDWTTAPSSSIAVAFAAWDQVNAAAGVTLVDSGSNTYPIDVSSAISTVKFVMGANQRDVNDGVIAMGFGDNGTGIGSAISNGSGYAIRVDGSNNFQAVVGSNASPYGFVQAQTTGAGGGTFEAFSGGTFEIHTSTVNLTFTDEPVGWLAIGDGGPWFPQGAPIRQGLDPLEPLPDDNQIPLGLITAYATTTGTAGQEHRTAGWGAWDNTDNQWFALNYLERDTSGTRNAITGRATYDDRILLFLTNKTTVGGYMTLTDDGAGGPHHTITGTSPGGEATNSALYFVHLGLFAGERFWAWLV